MRNLKRDPEDPSRPRSTLYEGSVAQVNPPKKETKEKEKIVQIRVLARNQREGLQKSLGGKP